MPGISLPEAKVEELALQGVGELPRPIETPRAPVELAQLGQLFLEEIPLAFHGTSHVDERPGSIGQGPVETGSAGGLDQVFEAARHRPVDRDADQGLDHRAGPG